jgi:tRNA A-37 threonylcarbamoyl transferase component Bud32
VHAHNASTQEAEEGVPEFQVTMGYRANLSKKKKIQRKAKEKRKKERKKQVLLLCHVL